MQLKMSYLLLVLCLLICDVLCENSRLLSVIQIFRHGERTPLIFSLNDPYKDPRYWDGIKRGHLTERGKSQHRDLGSFMRQRYQNFVSERYDPSDLIVKCSNTKRTEASARAFLEAFYSAGGGEDVDKIPFHKPGRSILKSLMNCPKYLLLYMRLMHQNEYFIDVESRMKDVTLMARKVMGIPLPSLLQGFALWDSLHIESLNNLQFNEEWTKSMFPFPLEYVARNFTLALCYNQEMQRLGVGSLLNAIIEHFDGILRQNKKKQKIVLYSGHDTNLACLLNTFGSYNSRRLEPVPVPFASSIIIELRENEQKKIFLNAYYKEGGESLQSITLRNCHFDCDYEIFKDIFKDVRLNEWEWVKECWNIF